MPFGNHSLTCLTILLAQWSLYAVKQQYNLEAVSLPERCSSWYRPSAAQRPIAYTTQAEQHIHLVPSQTLGLSQQQLLLGDGRVAMNCLHLHTNGQVQPITG